MGLGTHSEGDLPWLRDNEERTVGHGPRATFRAIREWWRSLGTPKDSEERRRVASALRGYASAYDKLHRDIADDFRKAADWIEEGL